MKRPVKYDIFGDVVNDVTTEDIISDEVIETKADDEKELDVKNISDNLDAPSYNEDPDEPDNKDMEKQGEGEEQNISDDLDGISDDLESLDKLLAGMKDEKSNQVEAKISEALTMIKKLQKQVNTLELENAELNKFGSESGLDPETIIFKNYFGKAKQGDEVAINKIKDMIYKDLGLELRDVKQTYLSNSISSSIDGMFDSSRGEREIAV